MTPPTICTGCKILKESKPRHGIQDYLKAKPVDILFLSDSMRWENGPTPITGKEQAILLDSMEQAGIPLHTLSWEVSPAVKCPWVGANSMGAKDKEICRKHVENTITAFKPKMIVCLGNQAFNMLTKKSGIMDKRGSLFDYNGIPVIPIYHPFQVIKEPRYKEVFIKDLQNAYLIYSGEDNKVKVDYSVVDPNVPATHEPLSSLLEWGDCISPIPVSIDIETTGFNFKTDRIRSISLSYREKSDGSVKTNVINFDIINENRTLEGLKSIGDFLLKLLISNNHIKVFHNAKFDLKFIFEFLVSNDFDCASFVGVKRVVCTKNLAKFVNENRPNSLKDLVKEYFNVIF